MLNILQITDYVQLNLTAIAKGKPSFGVHFLGNSVLMLYVLGALKICLEICKDFINNSTFLPSAMSQESE